MKVYVVKAKCRVCGKEFRYERKTPQGRARNTCDEHRLTKRSTVVVAVKEA